MFKIYVKNNYFFIKDATALYEGLRKDVRVNIDSEDLDNPKIWFSNVKDWNDAKKIRLSQIVDENDAPFADIDAFIDFYTENTGNVTDGSANNYTAVLNSIDAKASNLATIVTELQTANTTLTDIKADTTATNTKLDTLISKAADQITELQGIKTEIVAGNLKLDQIVTKLSSIDTNITTIKEDVALIKADISEIKGDVKLAVTALNNIETLIGASNDLLADILAELDVELVVNTFEKNNGTINYYQRDTILWDSETSTQISLTTEFTEDGINWTTTVPAGDVNLGFLNWGSDTFQLEDCAGNPIGPPQRVIKVVQLAKQVAKICNTEDITEPIVEAINLPKIGKKQDLLTWVATAGQTLEIPLFKFSTISLMASKGEFKIENNNNDFSSDFTLIGGTLNTFIEISSDGIGTATGATDVPNSIDTRANAYDMDILNNSFLIECVREGVLTIEVYK